MAILSRNALKTIKFSKQKIQRNGTCLLDNVKSYQEMSKSNYQQLRWCLLKAKTFEFELTSASAWPEKNQKVNDKKRRECLHA